MSKRAKIHKLKNAPKPFNSYLASTPSGSSPKWVEHLLACGVQSFASRHFQLDAEWAYPVWIKKMESGMIHYKVDGVGETFLMPRDNWQDVLAAFIGRKEL